MKILLVTHSFWPHRAGIETVAFEQARRLVKLGHQVCVVTGKRGVEPLHEVVEGLEINRVQSYLPFWGFGPPYPLFKPGITRLLAEKARWCDLVLAHGHPFLSTFFAARAAKKQGKPFYLVQHNTFLDYGWFLNLFERLNDWVVGRASLSAAQKVLCVSKATETYVHGVCPAADTVVLYNGVDCERFKPAKDKQAVRKKLGLPLGKFLAFTVRELSYKNGIDLLVGAAEELKGKENLLFLVAGKGPERGKIERLMAEKGPRNVRLVGFISDAELLAYYQAVDLFILPSKTGEGFPMVVLEAFASGLPVVATDTGGQTEIIRDGANGFIVAPNAGALAEKIGCLYADRGLVASMGKEARSTVAQFSWQKHMAQLLEVIA